jgi:thiol-disulfide isomerase/thioredoxin
VKRALLLLLLAALCSATSAEESPRPFRSGSYREILDGHQGKPFVIAFWSLSCTHCPAELKLLGRLRHEHPKLDIVLVSTDSPADARPSADFVARQGLAGSEQWIFDDAMPERLRHEIDRRWFGELPRTHFFDRMHQREAVSGTLDETKLLRWLRENL